MSKYGNHVVGGQEDGSLTFNEQEQCYEEVNQTQFIFDDDQDKVVPNGNVQVTFETKLQNMQRILDEMISLNGKKGKSKYGYLNSEGRRNLKRLSKFLNDVGESNGNN